jgi:hypothetical protein
MYKYNPLTQSNPLITELVRFGFCSSEQIRGSNCIDCIDDNCNSLRYKNCEPFTMKCKLLFIEILM